MPESSEATQELESHPTNLFLYPSELFACRVKSCSCIGQASSFGRVSLQVGLLLRLDE